MHLPIRQSQSQVEQLWSMELMMSSQSTLPSTLKSSLYNKITSQHQHLRNLAHKWKAQMQKMIPKGQDSTKQNLVHVVKEGETLTCISKMYRVPIYEIAAANKDILDLDLVFHGQHLNIPSSMTGHTQMTQPEDRQPRYNLFQRNQTSDSCNRYLTLKTFTSLSSHPLPYARTTGYFLVLVPLIAFCIRCIMVALYNRVSGALGHEAANELERHHPRSKAMRWRVALSDLNPDIMDTEQPRPDYAQLEEEDQELHSEDDHSNSYIELERDYQKFLSECGMSKWGYWRGGST